VKFAFITPRYGGEISSGPEHACRLLAERVAERHDVDVITTCARDERTWENEYAEGTDKMRGVVVRRFSVSQPHDAVLFNRVTQRLTADPHSREDELEWVKCLGPWSPGLIDHLKRQHRVYDALVFFSLYHATTVHGLGIAPDRSLLFPHVRLGAPLRFSLWEELLRVPRGIGLFSGSERRLIRDYVRVTPGFEEVVGIGIEPAQRQTYPRHQQDPADAPEREDGDSPDDEATEEPGYLEGRGVPFRRRHRLYGPVAIYAGRVEPDNGCEEMLEYFDSYASADADTSLVLMGLKMMKVPDEPYVRLAGVLPARERMVAYEAADVTIAPPSDDLLAQPLLESLAVGTPVLACARNEAAVEHCRRANAGLYYSNREEFVEGLRTIMTNARLRERLGENGRTYVRTHHRWDAVMGRFDRLAARARKN
jgi:glycosyltransferase involved in cell wall biosynthesis